ncbi:MAG: hypothetical protein MPJ78_19650, partial [Hyphomicrobiaceae bacterium]|nr:hypothetical protein [Hyphomicrobiaceae bacterium]
RSYIRFLQASAYGEVQTPTGLMVHSLRLHRPCQNRDPARFGANGMELPEWWIREPHSQLYGLIISRFE